MALVANALISLIARGALFLKVTPCSCPLLSVCPSLEIPDCFLRKTYALVQVDRVLAGHDVGDGRAGGLLGRHAGEIISGVLVFAAAIDGLQRTKLFGIESIRVICCSYVLRRRLDLVRLGGRLRGVEEESCVLGFDKPTSCEFCTWVFREFCESARGPALKWHGAPAPQLQFEFVGCPDFLSACDTVSQLVGRATPK